MNIVCAGPEQAPGFEECRPCLFPPDPGLESGAAPRAAGPAGFAAMASPDALLFRRLGSEPALDCEGISATLAESLEEAEGGLGDEPISICLSLPGLGQVELGLERQADLLQISLQQAAPHASQWFAANARRLERRLFRREGLKVGFELSPPGRRGEA